MIARDRVVLRYKNADGDPVEKIVRGVIVTDVIDPAPLGPIAPFIGTVKLHNYFRVILPRTLPADARELTLSFRNRSAVRPETIAPILDARGRVRHYEAIVR